MFLFIFLIFLSQTPTLTPGMVPKRFEPKNFRQSESKAFKAQSALRFHHPLLETEKKRKNKHTKPQKNHHTNSRMGNSNNKMTRSCVPSSTGSDKNVKTMDERIDALVLRLHEVFLRSRSSRFKPVVFVRIFKHFERFFPVKSRLCVVVF